MSITLSENQQQAIEAVLRCYYRGDKHAVISGYAGTGKSTIVKEIVRALPIDKNSIVYAAYTGKACEVLKRNGNDDVITLHKLLYKSSLRPDGSYRRIPVTEIPYLVVVADECSMIPIEMVEILEKLPNVFTIYLGDNFQLPPINKNADNHLLDNPLVQLTEIFRQENDSDIIDITTDIRMGKELDLYKGRDVQIINKTDLTDSMLLWADIVLCATNKTRHYLNQYIRKLKGMEGEICEGEKVICLHNNWDIESEPDGYALINGTIGTISQIYDSAIDFPKYLGGSMPVYKYHFTSEDNQLYEHMAVDKQLFLTEKPYFDSQQTYKILKNPKWKDSLPDQMTYGYAITCHKAQGSQWQRVLVYEEGFPYEKEEHARWLYTTATRSSSKLVIVR